MYSQTIASTRLNAVVSRCLGFAFLLALTVSSNYETVVAQQPGQWMPQQMIPRYHPDTPEPPYLIADQNRTVHAFSHQQVGDGEKEIAIVYNQWTLENGWTPPLDIALSPIKHQARLLGVTLDQAGIFHLLFFGGDEAESGVYYIRGVAANAANAQSWSAPISVGQDAVTPENGGIAGDGKEKLVMVYSGKAEGNGWYTAMSMDSGNSWTDPFPFFPTNDDELTPYYLRLYPSQSGLLHAVWSINDVQNHGVAIYYAAFSYDDLQWGAPVQLAETKGGLGTLAPSLIEYQGTLFVMYYEGTTGKKHLRRSEDSGESWTEPVTPFLHIGLNGPGFFVVDANNTLHFFWGQRLAGTPDTHGMWHTIWQNGQWSLYEAVVSGPRISDMVTNQAFDPIAPIAAVRQGNILLAVWRTDYGLKGNGIWYSYKILDAPELPIVALPVLPGGLSTQPAQATVPPVNIRTTATPMPVPISKTKPVARREGSMSPESVRSPASNLVVSLTPPLLLISLTVVIRRFLRYRKP